jgi:hypothetical protein
VQLVKLKSVLWSDIKLPIPSIRTFHNSDEYDVIGLRRFYSRECSWSRVEINRIALDIRRTKRKTVENAVGNYESVLVCANAFGNKADSFGRA